MASLDTACPCGNPLSYRHCCGRFHDGLQHLQAPTAEALMRSRYSAYVLGLADYLSATWHASTRPASAASAASGGSDDTGLKWLGLEVRRHAMQDADHATVEFVARSKMAGRAHRLHEISRFAREDGRWFYVDGDLR